MPVSPTPIDFPKKVSRIIERNVCFLAVPYEKRLAKLRTENDASAFEARPMFNGRIFPMLNRRMFLSVTTLPIFLLSLCAVSFADAEIQEGGVPRVETETWRAVDLPFTSNKSYGEGEQLYLLFDATFTNPATGTSLTVPGFWDGGETFVVRFAPTEPGEWDYRTAAPDDPALDGKTGKVIAKPYSGDLELYRRGFVTTNGAKYFVYADGTPFFYLGDTHWNLYHEEFDSPGPYAGETGAESHFKYIVDKRVEQGFTVYQSEPIGAHANLADGKLDASDAAAFKIDDLYFQYLAEKGLVHANAEFFYSSSMTQALAENERYLEAISRYWVARYSAYPVMWTLAQEADNDFYRERGDQKFYDANDNPWVNAHVR